MILLDLFSGIGGFSKGLLDAGLGITKHYFSEIDKHAIAIYKYQFKNSEYVGSVTTLDGRAITRPNIITFGSPCQDFSVAGRRAGMAGQRSSLIGEAIRLITECKPNIFIWENVKGVFSSNDGEDFWAVIQAFTNIGGYRLEWQLLNTAWFLPQNRERIYLIGHLAESTRNFSQVFPITEVCRLSDESQEGTKGDGEGVRSDNTRPIIARTLRNGHQNDENVIKANTITDRYYKDGAENLIQIGDFRMDEGIRINNDNLRPTLQAREREDGSGQPIIVASRGRGEGQQIEQRNDDKTNSITSVQKDNLVVIGNVYNTNAQAGKVYDPNNSNSPTVSGQRINSQGFIQVPARWSRTEKGKEERRKSKKNGKDYTPFSDGARELSPAEDNNVGCITNAVNKDSLIFNVQKTTEKSHIRRLTEVECERLQGFPDNFTEYGDYDGIIKKVPNTQRYKTLGNAVTVAVVREIGKRLLNK